MRKDKKKKSIKMHRYGCKTIYNLCVTTTIFIVSSYHAYVMSSHLEVERYLFPRRPVLWLNALTLTHSQTLRFSPHNSTMHHDSTDAIFAGKYKLIINIVKHSLRDFLNNYWRGGGGIIFHQNHFGRGEKFSDKPFESIEY